MPLQGGTLDNKLIMPLQGGTLVKQLNHAITILYDEKLHYFKHAVVILSYEIYS